MNTVVTFKGRFQQHPVVSCIMWLRSTPFWELLRFLFITFALFYPFLDYASNTHLMRTGEYIPRDVLLMTNFILGYAFLIISYYLLGYMPKVYPRSLMGLSLILSCFMVFGYSYIQVDSWAYVFGDEIRGRWVLFGSIPMFIGYYLYFRLILAYLYTFFSSRRVLGVLFLRQVPGYFSTCLTRRPFVFCFLVILLAWSPYIYVFYPSILSPDPVNQLRMFFNSETNLASSVQLLDPNVLMTNHHPYFHTWLMGTLLNFGGSLGSDNLGLFFHSALQILILAAAFSFSIYYLRTLGMSSFYLGFMLLIYAFVPAFPFYVMMAVKDVFFSAFLIFFVVFIHRLLICSYSSLPLGRWWWTLGFVSALFFCLFRHNGIYVLVPTFVLLILFLRGNRLIVMFLFTLLLGFHSYWNSTLLPGWKVSPTSPREMLSLPFQQTARFVRDSGYPLNQYQKLTIDRVLGYSTLASRYKSHLADPVKNRFKRHSSSQDLKNYFSIWWYCFKKRPDIYFQTLLAGTYGYYYPPKAKWYFHSAGPKDYARALKPFGVKYSFNRHSTIRYSLTFFGKMYPYIPILGMYINVASALWALLIMAFFYISKGSYRHLLLLFPFFMVSAICFVSPSNTYFRYSMPITFALPLLLGLLFHCSYLLTFKSKSNST
jgi:hypothetical protein